jgi:hypothetical protein
MKKYAHLVLEHLAEFADKVTKPAMFSGTGDELFADDTLGWKP